MDTYCEHSEHLLLIDDCFSAKSVTPSTIDVLSNCTSKHVRESPGYKLNLKLNIGYVLLALTIMPQVVISVGLGDQVKSVDLIGIAFAVSFIFWSLTGAKAMSVQIFSLLIVLYASLVFLGHILLSTQRDMYVSNTPYLARHFAIFSNILILNQIQLSSQLVRKYMVILGLIGTLVSLGMAISHMFGNTLFDAHQTLLGENEQPISRLGGLVGESGAFGFNAFFVFAILVCGLTSSLRNPIFLLSIIALFLVYSWIVYRQSSTRIFLLTSGSFLMLLLIFYPFHSNSTRLFFVVFPAIGIAVCVVMMIALRIDVEIGSRGSINELFAGDLDLLSSGRTGNWTRALSLLMESWPIALFGAGYSIPNMQMDYPLENMFVFHLLTYGFCGSFLLFCFYFQLLIPLFRKAAGKDATAKVLCFLLFAVFLQWQVNDINLYYQTFPVLLFLTHWYGISSEVNASELSVR